MLIPFLELKIEILLRHVTISCSLVVPKVASFSGTKIYMLKLGDFWSSNTIDLYLHRR